MITEQQYKLFLDNVVNQIDSDWVVLGGSLLRIIQASSRSTSDIDICSIDEMTNDNRLSLMSIAQASGLPIEAINPAADFFLRQIPNWKNSLVLLVQGKKGNIFRPSLELYIILKMNRGTDTDVSDCIEFIKWHKTNSLSIDEYSIREILSKYDSLKSKRILESL
jgi:hypothetical protein